MAIRTSLLAPLRAATVLTLAAVTVAVAAPAGAATLTCGDLAGFGGSSPLTPDGYLRLGNDCVDHASPPEGGVLNAEASADPGIVRASAMVALPAGVSHLARSGAAWEETAWIINHPDPTKQGSAGVLRFEFFVEGFLDATGAGQSSVTLAVQSNLTARKTLFSSFANGTTGSKSVLVFVEGAFSFRFGETNNFFFSLDTRAERAPGKTGEGFAEAVFTNTGYWGGLTAVEDGNGPLSGFTFSGGNASFGERITASLVPDPVPLPASVWLFGSATAGLLLRGRKMRGAAPAG